MSTMTKRPNWLFRLLCRRALSVEAMAQAAETARLLLDLARYHESVALSWEQSIACSQESRLYQDGQAKVHHRYAQAAHLAAGKMMACFPLLALATGNESGMLLAVAGFACALAIGAYLLAAWLVGKPQPKEWLARRDPYLELEQPDHRRN